MAEKMKDKRLIKIVSMPLFRATNTIKKIEEFRCNAGKTIVLWGRPSEDEIQEAIRKAKE